MAHYLLLVFSVWLGGQNLGRVRSMFVWRAGGRAEALLAHVMEVHIL